MTLFAQLGGASRLAAIIGEFVDRVFDDTMIGFLFARANRARLKQLEYEHAAQFLGADTVYSGRDLREAHRRHPIMGGHFGRRRQILKETLERHGVPPHIIAAWLTHQDELREQVTADLVTECVAAQNNASPASPRGTPPDQEG